MHDVFLSHNSRDKEIVRHLYDALLERGLRPWLDEHELIPGRPWLEELERIIQTTKTAAVLFGPAGLGPWEKPEMRACLRAFVGRQLPIIPVLLPGAPEQPNLPEFLNDFTWVDLRSGFNDEGLDRLVWGITGTKPNPQAAPSAPAPPGTRPSASRALWLEPAKTQNWVHLGSDQHAPNSQFSVATRFHLFTGGRPVVLLGVAGLHLAHGCYCLPRTPEITVNAEPLTYTSDWFVFERPYRIEADDVALMAYGRHFRPPLVNMCAADCDYGDFEVRIQYRAGDELFEEEFFFEFQPGGALAPIKRMRDVPVLNDEHLKKLCAEGKLSDEELQLLLAYPASKRYRVAFSDNPTEHYLDIPDHHRNLLRSVLRP